VARRDELTRAFERLSVDHRVVLVLTHYLGYSAPEIARILGIPAGTVASRLHYGAAAMRRALHPGVRTTPDLEATP
jgi:RNA polymerase sigma-70 factor (ECF subfamily)